MTKIPNHSLQTLLLENPPWKCEQLVAAGTVSEYFVEPISRRIKWPMSIATCGSKKPPETCIVKRFVKNNKLLPIQLYLRDITNLADLLCVS